MLDFFAEPFVFRALLAGLCVAMVSGVMGAFVVWRRMAYFGDSLSHSALLGVAAGLLLGVNVTLGIVITSVLFAALLLILQQRRWLATDTLLGILAHSALSIGLVTISFLHHRVDLQAYLFGDLLTVTPTELVTVAMGGASVLGVLSYCWPKLLLLTLHEDLARAEGVSHHWMNAVFMLLMTLVVALSVHVVGILLITSMLILPAATARGFSRSPERMVVLSAVLGMAAVTLGLTGSLHWDTPTGPSVVTAAALIFVASCVLKVVLPKGA